MAAILLSDRAQRAIRISLMGLSAALPNAKDITGGIQNVIDTAPVHDGAVFELLLNACLAVDADISTTGSISYESAEMVRIALERARQS